MKKLTIIEIYNRILYVTAKWVRADACRNNPISEAIVIRKGNIEAVKRSWYYFNNQEEFLKLPLIKFYYSKD